MAREILFKAKKINNGEWIKGYYCRYGFAGKEKHYIIPDYASDLYTFEIDINTLCQYTELTDKNGNKIWENDITKLVLPDGEVRYFKVSIKSVVRKVVNHPDFIDGVSKVEISGVVFEWNGYELLPCVDETGTIDYKKMQVVGNIFDNPELFGGELNG